MTDQLMKEAKRFALATELPKSLSEVETKYLLAVIENAFLAGVLNKMELLPSRHREEHNNVNNRDRE